MGNIFSGSGSGSGSGLKLSENESAATDSTYPLATSDVKILDINQSEIAMYFVLCAIMVLATISLELSAQSMCFIVLAVSYTAITYSLTSTSILLIGLEIVAWTTMIEIFNNLEFNSVSWALVFILPILCMLTSLYYMLFYMVE
tara:strand:+ start:310 stop:741 length:432 start_codon:yes stop_codon:yes gene_type:complete